MNMIIIIFILSNENIYGYLHFLITVSGTRLRPISDDKWNATISALCLSFP